jgi:hypothetical protein
MARTVSRYTEEQIIAVLKEAEAALSAAEVIRRHRITPHTFCRWKAKFAGMEVSDTKRPQCVPQLSRTQAHASEKTSSHPLARSAHAPARSPSLSRDTPRLLNAAANFGASMSELS